MFACRCLHAYHPANLIFELKAKAAKGNRECEEKSE